MKQLNLAVYDVDSITPRVTLKCLYFIFQYLHCDIISVCNSNIPFIQIHQLLTFCLIYFITSALTLSCLSEYIQRPTHMCVHTHTHHFLSEPSESKLSPECFSVYFLSARTFSYITRVQFSEKRNKNSISNP